MYLNTCGTLMDIFISGGYNNGKNLKCNGKPEVVTVTSQSKKIYIFLLLENILKIKILVLLSCSNYSKQKIKHKYKEMCFHRDLQIFCPFCKIFKHCITQDSRKFKLSWHFSSFFPCYDTLTGITEKIK